MMRPPIDLSCALVAAALLLAGSLSCGQTGSSETPPQPKETSLPAPATEGGMALTQSIAGRRSVRQFAPTPLTLEQISQLTWAAQGITEPTRKLRAAPSAGATYPLELYLLTEDGLFHYRPDGHKLVHIGNRDLRRDLSHAALDQRSVAEAPLSIVLTAVFSRTESRYAERGRMYVHIEVGHVAQNVHLQAVALGLGSVPVGAFREAAVSDVLGLPAEQVPLYIIPVGQPR